MRDCHCVSHEGRCIDVRCDKCSYRLEIYPRKKRKIFLDMDGVLADFDKRAEEVIGTNDHHKFTFVYGQDETWKRIHAVPDFFLSLEVMPDIMSLLHAVRGQDISVLTALPRTNTERVKSQKETWVALNVNEDIPVITCFTQEKPDYCRPGDILIDDRAVVAERWVAAGGHFILHTDAADTERQLKALGVNA